MLQLHQEKRHRILLLVIMSLLLILKSHTSANAASESANLSVTAAVTPKCKINSGTMAFGAYDPMRNANLNMNGSITLTCTKNTLATVTLDAGMHASQASGTTRAMRNAIDMNGASRHLSYELYKDSSRSTVWSTSSPVTLTATSAAPIQIPVYGTIPQRQNVQDGSYTDTVLITVNF